jgi:2-oxoglutarate dehydrogenase E2 component (dihydrolipoamide succinyltransferase)
MQIEMKVPEMGESITEAVVARLLVKSGDFVEMDQEVIELETEKVNQVLAAPQAGRIEFRVAVDETIGIGHLIALIDTASERPAQSEKPKEEPEKEAKKEETAKPAPQPSPPSDGARYSIGQFLEEAKRGEEAPSKKEPQPAVASTPTEGSRTESRRRMPKIRQVIARRLVEVQQTTAMLTTFNECDMSAVMELRAKHKEEFAAVFGVKLGFMSFFVKAVVSALQQVPSVNSYIDDVELVQRHYYDIGVAVSTERGLVVPVIRDCDKLSFAGIEKAIADQAKKARSGGLSIDDLEGGGFTITNGGVFGSLLSTPILNAPQSGILGMHAIQERPVAVKGQVVIRPMMYLAMSYDHRVIDGREAVTFLVRLKENIEDPSRLLLDLWKGH